MSEEGDTIILQDLLQCLIGCSEKAAEIARTFRSQDELLGQIVEEKSGIVKNGKLVQDFKTLADVLVQETIKRDVGKKFPVLISKIQGEEQNSFQNTQGELIKVELTDSMQDTTSLLCKVLDGKVKIVKSLASIVHSNDAMNLKDYSSATIPASSLGIWIDPIDSTAEYIQAKPNKADEHGIVLYGLKCVCVLIGVYDLNTGIPIMGIINQPFFTEIDNTNKWESGIYWGLCYKDEVKTSELLATGSRDQKVIVVSCFENKKLLSIMQSKYSVVPSAGAGYKCLAVATEIANLYVLSLQNTHYWDTCGPHAILVAQGGGIVNFNKILNSEETLNHSNISKYQLTYLEDSSNKNFKNTGGIIAYKDENDLLEFLQLLEESGYRDSLK